MNLPIEVILNVLCQVHIKEDKVMEVTPAEGVLGSLVGQVAAPLADTADSIQGDFGCVLHVLQHCFQRHIGDAWASIWGFTEKTNERKKSFNFNRSVIIIKMQRLNP